jgi:hypothetical protein
VRQAIALVVALLFLLVSLSAEAKKKKKPAKKGKAPAGKVKSDRGLPPPDTGGGSDEESSDEKPAAKKKPAMDESEGEEKSKPTPPSSDAEGLPEEPAPKKAAKPKKEVKEEAAPAEGGLVALQFGVGGKALFRNLSWTDAMGRVSPYSLAPGPEVTTWLEAYPAAFATDGFAANIGVFGRFDYGFGASSKTPGGAMTLTTKYQDFLAGLKVRIPLGTFIPYVAGAYGMQKFHLEPAAPDRPNFNYGLIHAGAGARIQLTPVFDIDIGAGYLIVLTPGQAAGEVASPPLYPKSTAYGIDATLSVGYRVTSLIGIRVGGDFRQIGLATHWTSANTALQTGGALDRYISGWGGVEVVLDAVGGGPGHGDEEAPPAKKAPSKAKKPAPEDGEPDVTPDSADSKPSKGEDE